MSKILFSAATAIVAGTVIHRATQGLPGPYVNNLTIGTHIVAEPAQIHLSDMHVFTSYLAAGAALYIARVMFSRFSYD